MPEYTKFIFIYFAPFGNLVDTSKAILVLLIIDDRDRLFLRRTIFFAGYLHRNPFLRIRQPQAIKFCIGFSTHSGNNQDRAG
jgi:hypothetical protein